MREEEIAQEPYGDSGLRPDVIEFVRNELGWTYPTSIQRAVYPLAVKRHNPQDRCILLDGTRKDGRLYAYIESSIQAHADKERRFRYVRPKAIVLAPSSELARQVAEEFNKFEARFKVKSSLITSDKSIDEQLRGLSTQTDIIISTPGRLHQHLAYIKAQPDPKAVLCMSRLQHFVVDECDKLLSLGFLPEVLNVWESITPPLERHRGRGIQVIVCSATIVQGVHGNMSVPKSVKQIQYEVTSRRKTTLLLYLIRRRGNVSLKNKKTLIFVRTIQRCTRLVERLTALKLRAAELHSKVSPTKRLKVIQGIKLGEIDYIVATDIATRGIDLPILDYVVNFDLPNVPADYVHRVGRVGRAGREGVAVAFVAKDPVAIKHTNAPDATLDEQQMMRDITALLADSFTDKHASKIEKRKIPGPFLDVDSYYELKPIIGDPKYRELAQHAILDSRSRSLLKGEKGGKTPPTEALPEAQYTDLINEFNERAAKKKGVIVTKKEATARLHSKKR
ncbi:hypothetical protein L0F63_000194 [Massospora cicadina]|nr:hypothetical protein L0F63_000194 [Massospora cicadina]